MIVGLLYVSFVVEDVDRSRRAFRSLFGLGGKPMGPDSFLGAAKGALIALPNDCWLYVAESGDPGSPIGRFIGQKGPGLERLAFLSDDIEEEFERVRQAGVQLAESDLVDTPLGRRFVVPAEHMRGILVELIEPASGTWESDTPESTAGILGLQHIGGGINDFGAARDAFGRLLELHPAPIEHGAHLSFMPGNDHLWIDVAEGVRGQDDRLATFVEERGYGLEHICLEVNDIREAVKRVTAVGVPIYDHKIYTNRSSGFAAFVYPEHTTGVLVELIEPFSTSPGYRGPRY